MFGRGNYAAPVGHGPYASNPPFPQRPPTPPPPFSQSSHLPLPTAVPLVQPPVPPQVGQLVRPVCQHPPGPSQQVPLNPLLSSGINGQPYFTPALPPPPSQPLHVPGSSQMQQNLLWTHTAPFVPPTGPPSAPRVVPPPPSQGQTLLSSQVHQSPGNPPASSFYTSPPVGSFEHPMPQLSDTGPAGPPPPLPPPSLPSSPPRCSPLPSSSPPSTSLSSLCESRTSIPIPVASESAYHPEIGSRVNKSSALETSTSGSLGGVLALYLVGDAVRDGELGSKTVSAQGENLISDLPPPPLMPADDRTVHRIEVLCQFIAKNGPEFEKMTCQKESGNPEFKFLFGGEPGSEAAVAHEYFLWTKRKFLLGSRSVEYQGSHDFPSRPSGGSSSQLNIMSNVGLPYSPADSDMDMEDDITHPDEEPQSCFPNELGHETVLVSDRRDKEQELQPLLSTAEHSLGKDAADGNFMYSGLQGSGEQIQGTETSSIQTQSIIRKPFIKVDGLGANSSGDIEGPLVTNVMKTSVSDEDLSQPNVSKNLAEIRLEKIPNQLVKQDTSPFSLLQVYASGESSDDEARLVAVIPMTAAPSVKVDTVSLDTDAMVDLGRDHGIKSVVESHKGFEQLPLSSSFKPEGVMAEADMPSTAGKLGDLLDNIRGHQEYLKDGMPQREPRQKDASRDTVDANVKKNENSKCLSFTSKVDKFGRWVREGASDSESGGSPRYNRRQGKRGRSRSRTRSPHDTRRRRSPRRRKVMRGRSRSLSPKRRRSRSKSPLFRHGDEFGGDKMRRDKGHRSECFDFIRGKCYRGASCRYLHHDDKSDRSRSYRSKQQFQNLPYGSRSCDLRGETEMPYKKFSREHVEGRIQELKSVNEVPTTVEKKDMKEEMDEDATRFHDKSGPMEPLVHPIPEANMEKIPGDAAHGRPSPSESLDLHQSCGPKSSPMHTPAPVAVDTSHLNEEAADESCINSSSLNITFPSERVSSQPTEPTESITPDHLPRLLPSFASISQDTNSSFKQDMPRDYNLNSPAAIFPSHSASAESRPPYQASLSYTHSQFPFPPNSSWSCLPPPPVQPHHPPPLPAFVNDRTLTPGPYSGPSVHIMQNMLPRRNDFSSQTSARSLTEFPALGVCQKQAYPPTQEPNRSLVPLDDLHPSTFPMSQPMTWSHGGTGLAGEDRFMGHPGPGLHSSNSFGQNKMYSQTMPFPRESPSKRTQAFPGDNLPPADGVASLHHELGNLSSTLSSYTSDLLDRNQPYVFSDFGISGISNHFNPYASTFDQPLSSKFTSNILLQEKDRPFSNQLGAAYSFSQVPVDGRGIASLGSRNLMCSQNSAHPVDGILPRPGDGQYDPLYDSIEPSFNSVRKSSYGQKREITDESDVIVRFSGSSNKSLDEKKQKKQKGGESDESLENEAYGETADGEVDAVENESLSNLNDAAETAAGEVEIDQVKARGKSKKSKDSRSMKPFKVALADFVKEVLKPSWRQGNMSKEAFKTIVKKTVDRVSGAMKSHQIPKSQAKINHYIDSSQRKLTKLVMGYVDKYVKV